MSSLVEPLSESKKGLAWIAGVGAVLLIWAAIAIPNLKRSELPGRAQTSMPPAAGYDQRIRTEGKPETLAPPASAMFYQQIDATKATAPAESLASNAMVDRKMIRTSSLELVVQHPAEAAAQIATLAERLGGYLVSSVGGGQDATSGTLTIRIPTARFEEASAEIRKLGVRVESEKVQAQDVTRQYVDQDANLRNLRAEETQYLTILKQAGTVKDLLAVSEKLSEVRGQIEQQQAEFNALSKQTETVSLAISLRIEAEAQVFGLNWRPLYQLKLGLRDGLENLATYATTMTTILFYLPAALLWVGTILAGCVMSWRTVRWVGRRWLGWNADVTAIRTTN